MFKAELRTIGFSDATTDSELSIRHLELTPNTSEISFRLSPNMHYPSVNATHQKYSKESIDSGCQNETIRYNCETNRKEHHCDIRIVDITEHNRKFNRKMDRLDLTVNQQSTSSSTLSDASSTTTTSKIITVEQRRRESQKYHSVVRSRFRKDGLVARSKSFQEQDVKPFNSNTRFYVPRRTRLRNDFDQYPLDETISHHNIEITVEDMDADNERTTDSLQSPDAPTITRSGHNECSSLNSSEIKYNRSKIRSGHILGRILRRMRKFTTAWRRSKNKARSRGEFIIV